MSTSSRCKKSFVLSDGIIDLNLLNSKYKKKMDSSIINNFNEYKNNKKKYEESGWFNKGCKVYLDYEKDEYRLPDEKKKYSKKYSSEISKCKDYLKNKDENKKQYKIGFNKFVKTKIKSKLTKVLLNPNEKGMTKLACYIQILNTLCNGRIAINEIINRFNSEYKKLSKSNTNNNEFKTNNAKTYLKCLLTSSDNNCINDNKYKYQTNFKSDNNFIIALDNIINNYSNC